MKKNKINSKIRRLEGLTGEYYAIDHKTMDANDAMGKGKLHIEQGRERIMFEFVSNDEKRKQSFAITKAKIPEFLVKILKFIHSA